MKTLQFILDNKKAIWAIAMTIHAAVVHIYLLVARAGGYRTLWKQFQGPEQAATPPPPRVDSGPIVKQDTPVNPVPQPK
jgi:hypothetical protein